MNSQRFDIANKVHRLSNYIDEDIHLTLLQVVPLHSLLLEGPFPPQRY
jgi:hypothetical protein